MWTFLTQLRQRPDNEKKLIALAVAALVTIVLFISWVSLSTFTFTVAEDVAMPEAQTASPISAMKEQFRLLGSVFNGSTVVEQ